MGEQKRWFSADSSKTAQHPWRRHVKTNTGNTPLLHRGSERGGTRCKCMLCLLAPLGAGIRGRSLFRACSVGKHYIKLRHKLRVSDTIRCSHNIYTECITRTPPGQGASEGSETRARKSQRAGAFECTAIGPLPYSQRRDRQQALSPRAQGGSLAQPTNPLTPR